MELAQSYKIRVRRELLSRRELYGGTDGQFAKIYGLSAAVYSRLQKGELEKIISESQWLQIGRELDINPKEIDWKTVRTKVYDNIEGAILFCQAYNRSMILVDDCGIGKTYCAKNIARTTRNVFYIDCSQCKNSRQFTKYLAKSLGIDTKGKFLDIKENVKYYLNQLDNPVVILDEAGDLEYSAFKDIKEYWNATDKRVGWFMMGADGLRALMDRAINNKKVGFAEIFSRFSDEYVRFTPNGVEDRKAFRQELLTQVATANNTGKTPIETLVKQCMNKEATLRHLETLIKLHA